MKGSTTFSDGKLTAASKFLGAALLFVLFLLATPGQAATITVTSGGDSGSNTLRNAIAAAASGDLIQFSGVTTVTLTSAELLVNKNLTIDGGANGVTITRSGVAQFRIFNISSGTVSLIKLTISNGNPGSGQAGGIQNNGNLTMTNCAVTGNASIQGGGIQNDNLLTMVNCTISGNTSTGAGGGFVMYGTTTSLTNCTISGNTASTNGGGFDVPSGTLNLTNCTVANNTAFDGGGMRLSGSTHVFKNTIIASNNATSTGNENITGTISSTSAYNLINNGGTGGLTNGTNGNQVNVSNPLLGALANNGGYTQTHLLLAGSPALDKGAAVSGVTTDQRGEMRPFDVSSIASASGGDHSDIGAVELQVTCNALTFTPASPLPGGTVGVSYSQTISALGGTAPYTYTLTSGTLPQGLTLASNGTLSGTPIASGTANFTVTAAHGGFGCSGSQAYTLTITCPTSMIGPSTLPNGTVGASYLQSISASGGTGTYAYTVSSGSLPVGLYLLGNGTLAGVPSTAGPFSFTVTATLGLNCTVSQAYSISIAACANTKNYTVNDTGDASDATPGDGICMTAGGGCTLRAAIEEVNAAPGCANNIGFSVTDTIKMSGAYPTLAAAFTFNGPGAASLTIKRNTGGNYRILNIPLGAAATINGLTLSNGRSDEGGAIRNAGSLTLNDCVLHGNATVGARPLTGGGAGVFNDAGSLTLNRCALINNTATGQAGNNGAGSGGGGGGLGGAVYNNGGIVAISNSTLSGNQATGGAGGGSTSGCCVGAGGAGGGNGGSGGIVLPNGASPTAGSFGGGGGGGGNGSNGAAGGRFGGGGGGGQGAGYSTNGGGAGFLGGGGGLGSSSSSRSGGGGGGGAAGGAVFQNGGTTTIVNSTIVNNTATGGVGGTSSYGPSNGGAGSSRGGGIYNESGTITLKNSIVAGNTAQQTSFADCDNNSTATTTTNGYNIFGSGTGSPTGGMEDQTVMPADVFTTVLSVLGYYGGQTPAHRPLTGSPAIDKGSAGVAVDQRNRARPMDQPSVPAASGGNGSDVGSIEVDLCISTVAFTPTSLSTIGSNVAYSQTFTASGGSSPYVFAVTSGSLPPGLALSLGGVLSGTPTMNGTYTFSIQVYDGNDCATTQSYTLEVFCPSITAHPVSQVICDGASAMLSVTLDNASGVGYQWRKGGVDINSATGSSYTIGTFAPADAGNYDVVISPPNCNPITSNAATLSVAGSTVMTNAMPLWGGRLNGSQFEVGTNGGSSGEAPPFAFDGTFAKSLIRYTANAGYVFTPSACDPGGKVINQMRIYTANDEVPRDPSSYAIYGTHSAISGNGPFALAQFTLISSGNLALPSGRNTSSLSDANSQLVSFANTTAYTSYMLVFPANSGNGISTQIGEVKFYPENYQPTLTPTSASIEQSQSTTGTSIGTATPGTTQAANTLTSAVSSDGTNFGTSATLNGVTISNVAVAANGNVTADLSATCAATNANFTVRITNNQSQSATASLTINVTTNVTANVAPTLTYNNTSVNQGSGTTVNPATGPTDDGSIASIVVQSVMPSTSPGTITVDNVTGVVTVPNNVPAGVYTVTIRATDNCGGAGGITDAVFTLTVGCVTSLTVNNTGDGADASPGNGVCETATGNGVCTLRAAIQEANALTACSPLTINFSLNGTFLLTSALPAIGHPNLTINGNGAANTIISGNNTVAGLSVTAAGRTLALNDLTITNANSNTNGAALNFSGGTGTLTLTNCVLSNNTTTANGGALYLLASGTTATLTNTTVSGNTAGAGGGLYVSISTLTLNSCTISGNSCTGSGGGVLVTNGATVNANDTPFSNNSSPIRGAAIASVNLSNVNVTRCTFTGNSGSGVMSSSLTTNITNSTISGNTGPGIDAVGGTTTITNSTFSANTTANLFASSPGTVLNLVNTLVAGNSSCIQSSQAIINATNSLIQGGLSCVNGTNTNNLTSAPLLGTLGNYGGTTQTIPLLPGSPAINAGTATGAPTTDQRGIARVGNVDIGAFESRGFTLAIAGGNNQIAAAGSAFASPLSVTVSSSNSEPVNGGRITFTPPGSGATATIAGNPATIASGTATSGTVTANATIGGPYTTTATATGGNSVNFNLTNDATVAVQSVNRASANPTCTNTSVSWTVTFSMAVTGVTASNFALVGGTGASISNVSGSGTTWTVMANTGTAGAVLGLNMGNSTGVTPGIGGLPFTGQTYTVNAVPSAADAGTDQTSTTTCDLPHVTLAANAPTIGTGMWSIQSGTGGGFGDASNRNSNFYGVEGNTYTLRWTVTNSPCPASTDEVMVTFPQIASAGPDQTVCSNPGTATMAGTMPNGGSGTWTKMSGPAGGNLTTPTSPTTTVTGLTNVGTYVFKWEVTPPACTTSLVYQMQIMVQDCCPATGMVWYVDAAAAPGGTGSSWTCAFQHLQDAIDAASSGHEIWVKAGTYLPTKEPDGTTDSSRDFTFYLENGVAVYGGFNGSETMRAQRDWIANPTILSGDLGTAGDNSDNCYNVVLSVSDANTTILDGFTVSGGNANGSGSLLVETITIRKTDGGGMVTYSSNPTVGNCTFSGNSAEYGGGMSNLSSNPTVSNCTFSGNTAVDEGGGMQNFRSSPTVTACTFTNNSAATTSAFGGGGGMSNSFNSSPTVSKCSFMGNVSNYHGGAMLNIVGSTPTVTNCLFSGNSTLSSGGAVSNYAPSTLINCTISGNKAGNSDGGGGIANEVANVVLTNCIIWNNRSGTNTGSATSNLRNYGGAPIITYSLIQNNNPSGTGNLNGIPNAADSNYPSFTTPLDPATAPSTSGDFHIGACSPAINKGDNTGAPATDLFGNARPFGASVDLGVHEFQAAPTPAVATCQNTTVLLNGAGNGTLAASALNNGSTGCAPLSFSASQTGFTCANLGPNTVTLTVTALNGATATCNATVTVNDLVAPSIGCPANQTVSANATCQGTVGNYTSLATKSDNCSAPGSISVTQSPPSGGLFTGSQTVTLTATDGSNNSATCAFTVSVTDNTAPTIVCPANQTVSANATCQGTVGDYVALATKSDNCTAPNNIGVTQSPAPGGLFSGSQTVTLTATDASTNSATCVFSVSIRDETPPTVGCPANQTVTGNATCQGILGSYAALATKSDNCSAPGGINVAQSPISGTNISGTTTVTLTATDAANNSATCVFSVSIRDVTPPTVGCPANQTVTANANCQGTLGSYAALATKSDNCSAPSNISVSQSPASGGLFTGSQTVTLTASDFSENTATCSFVVTVVDNIAPSITCPANQTVSANASCQGTLGNYVALATKSDNCTAPNSIGVTQGPLSGTTISATTTVVLTATDASTNSAYCSFSVSIRDVTPPTVACPTNQTVSATTNVPCTAVVNGINATFNDLCSSVSLAYALTGTTMGSGSGQASGTTFQAGSTTVTYTATDGAGLSATCALTVYVNPCQVTFTGTITWKQDNTTGVKDATVAVTGDRVGSATTATNGTYSLTLDPGSNFVLTPSKNLNKLNGVNAQDVQRIQQHLSGGLITNPWQLVAADVNGNNLISALDANILQLALLGNPSALDQMPKSWRFVPKTHTMGTPPWGFPENIVLTGAAGTVNNLDFWGFKVGDLVSTYANPANSTGQSLVLTAQDESLTAGQTLTVDVTAAALRDLTALQLALRFDPEYLQLSDVQALDGLPLTKENFGTYQSAEGSVRVVWSGAQSAALRAGAPLFRLQFVVLEGGPSLSGVLRLDDETLLGQVFNSDGAASGVSLRFEGVTAVQTPVFDSPRPQLLQNQPNPFTRQTTIGFVLPEACEAQLRIVEAGGRVVAERRKQYPAGRHAEVFDLNVVPGVLYYELTTPFGVLVRKMVVVE